MYIKLNDDMMNKIYNNNLKAKDVVGYVLANCECKLTFNIEKINGELTRDNINSQLALCDLYDVETGKCVKQAYIYNNYIVLNF